MQTTIECFKDVGDNFSRVGYDMLDAARKAERAAGFFGSDTKKMENAVDKMGNSVKNFTLAVENIENPPPAWITRGGF